MQAASTPRSTTASGATTCCESRTRSLRKSTGSIRTLWRRVADKKKAVVDGAVLAAAARRAARGAEGGQSAEPVPATDGAAGVEVHAMMAVTQDVLATMAGVARLAALQSAFDAAFVRVNADLAASQVAVRVKLVKIAETN